MALECIEDEASTQRLELNAKDIKMSSLIEENGMLIHRWLDKMNQEANLMNTANSQLARALYVSF